MNRYAGAAVVLVMCVGGGLLPAQENKPAPPQGNARVELRWAELKHIPGVTDPKGVQTSCDPDDLAYFHVKPVITNADIASATLNYHDLRASNIGEQWTVKFEITAEGKKRLVKEADGKKRFIAITVDGKYWGLTYFVATEADKFAPGAGFFPKENEARRVAETFKK